MMDTPLVSCIVPTFNSRRFVGEALASILAQTYRPLEIIVADDGSTDGTIELVRAHGGYITLVSQATVGPASTRNLGLDAARGDFIAFLDADDRWHPEKLERQIARFLAQPALDLCVTAAQLFWTADLEQERQPFAAFHACAIIVITHKLPARQQMVAGYAVKWTSGSVTILTPAAEARSDE